MTTASRMVLAGALALGAAGIARAEGPSRAAAEIVSCATGEVLGEATFKERKSEEGIKNVDVRVQIEGLADGKHAVHVHEVASCVPCAAAGGHFDPGPASNPSPDGNHPHHAGDLVNVEVHNGTGTMQTTSSRFTLSPGPLSIFDSNGSALIVHLFADTYCPDGPVAGCAGGGRAACGVIEPLD